MLQFLHIGFYIKCKETKQVPKKEMQKEIGGALFFPTQLVSPHITVSSNLLDSHVPSFPVYFDH